MKNVNFYFIAFHELFTVDNQKSCEAEDKSSIRLNEGILKCEV